MTMQVYKWIMYADIHYDKLGAKCVTIDDSEAVERAIFERARTGNFDFTLFPGDRYLKREPADETKVRADRVIYDCVHKGGKPHFHLIGNHDWVDNTMKWHTSESLKLFNNVYVMDEARTWTYKNVAIHALPADFSMDMSKYDINPNFLNIFVFHDTVIGSYMSEDRTLKFESGMKLEEFDKPEFDLVVAGDVHIRQPFNLINTQGGYLGSVTQRTRADANKERGWTEITATNMGSKWSFDVKFVPTKNLFTKLVFPVTDETTMNDFHIDKKDVEDQLVEVRLIGDKKNVDRLADDEGWKTLEKEFQARRVELLRAYQIEQSEAVVDLTSSNSSVSDLELYLDSSFSSVGNLKREDIIAAVKRIGG